MKKILSSSLILLAMLGMVACTDSESIPSNNLYKSVSEKNMPAYCKHEAARELGVYSSDLYLYPIEYNKGAKIIYGRYSVDNTHLEEFACIFNNNDTFAGLKINHRNVKNKLCIAD